MSIVNCIFGVDPFSEKDELWDFLVLPEPFPHGVFIPDESLVMDAEEGIEFKCGPCLLAFYPVEEVVFFEVFFVQGREVILDAFVAFLGGEGMAVELVECGNGVQGGFRESDVFEAGDCGEGGGEVLFRDVDFRCLVVDLFEDERAILKVDMQGVPVLNRFQDGFDFNHDDVDGV